MRESAAGASHRPLHGRGDAIRTRAARLLFPAVGVALAVIWASESAAGFSHVVGRVGVPTLFAVMIGVSLVVWLRPALHRTAEAAKPS